MLALRFPVYRKHRSFRKRHDSVTISLFDLFSKQIQNDWFSMISSRASIEGKHLRRFSFSYLFSAMWISIVVDALIFSYN